MCGHLSKEESPGGIPAQALALSLLGAGGSHRVLSPSSSKTATTLFMSQAQSTLFETHNLSHLLGLAT